MGGIGTREHLGPVFGMDEITVQYVIMAADQPKGDPIADRQYNDADNTNFKHLGAYA